MAVFHGFGISERWLVRIRHGRGLAMGVPFTIQLLFLGGLSLAGLAS